MLLGSSEILSSEYNWPPYENKPISNIVGPFYESLIEKEQPFYSKLNKVLLKIHENPKDNLPPLFYNKIKKLIFSFHLGFSNDEEWDIKTSKQNGTFDVGRAVDVLANNKFRQPGLELAIRVKPTSNPDPDYINIEGYRFIFQSNIKGKFEWFDEKLKRSADGWPDTIHKAIIWQLTKPFKSNYKSFKSYKDQPYWKDNDRPNNKLDLNMEHLIQIQ